MVFRVGARLVEAVTSWTRSTHKMWVRIGATRLVFAALVLR